MRLLLWLARSINFSLVVNRERRSETLSSMSTFSSKYGKLPFIADVLGIDLPNCLSYQLEWDLIAISVIPLCKEVGDIYEKLLVPFS